MRYVIVGKNDVRTNTRTLSIKTNTFTSKEFVSVHTLEKLTIRKPLLDDNRTNNFAKNGNLMTATIVSQIEQGKYPIDEDESNNDKIVFYLEYKIEI